MNYLKRAMISTKKHKFKTIILFCIVCLLTGLTAMALTIRQAIVNTDIALRSQLPAVVTLRADEEKLLYYSEHDLPIGDSGRITAELIQEIGSLPYVRVFDFTENMSFFSSEFTRVQADDVTDFLSLRSMGIDHLEHLSLSGVYYHGILNIQSGPSELVDGRTFSREEVVAGDHVLVVSQAFMEANQLSLNEVISLDLMIWGAGDADFTDEYLLLKEPFEFEIIGVFDQELTYEGEHFRAMAVEQHMHAMNQIYVPVTTLTPMLEAWAEVLPETGLPETEVEAILLDIDAVHDPIVFLLYDPIDLIDFREAADELIPYFWTFSDLTNAYEDMSSAMATMLDIANGIFAGAALSTIVSLGLLVLMLLRERQHEIGIYLALGERKKRIFAQLLVEISMISLIAVTCALFLGNIVATRMTENMLRAELANQVIDENWRSPVWAGSPEALGFTHSMTHEEMLEVYDATMNVENIAMFYVVTLTTILVATVVPVLITVNQNPKKLLILKDASIS